MICTIVNICNQILKNHPYGRAQTNYNFRVYHGAHDIRKPFSNNFFVKKGKAQKVKVLKQLKGVISK